MKNYITLCLFLSVSYAVNAQKTINSDYVIELEKLEAAYIESNEDPKGIDIINNCNSSYKILEKAYQDKGLDLDLKNIDKFTLKSNPGLKSLYKNYRSAFKMKVQYFNTKDAFKETLDKAYPGFLKNKK